VVDDAIVMIRETSGPTWKMGRRAVRAARGGAREIGFTVISATISLIAVFIPLLFMTGMGPHVPGIRTTLDHRGGDLAVGFPDADPMMCRRAAAPQSEAGGNSHAEIPQGW